MATDQLRIEADGLRELTAALKGPAFKDVNSELRRAARGIANDVLVPLVSQAVASSGAPQAAAMAATVRAHSDRVPVVVVGKVNPRFSSGFRRPGGSAAQSKARRGSMARGVVSGPLGGRRDTRADENYYRIPRDPSWGALGRALSEGGQIVEAGTQRYLDEYLTILRRAGFDVTHLPGG